MTLRRHHCRQCGQIFCYRCCSSKALLQPGSGTALEERVEAHYVWGATEADVRTQNLNHTRASNLIPGVIHWNTGARV